MKYLRDCLKKLHNLEYLGLYLQENILNENESSMKYLEQALE